MIVLAVLRYDQRLADMAGGNNISESTVATGGLSGVVLSAHVDAWPCEADGIGVVAALGDDCSDELGQGVSGNAQPVCPGRPVVIVASDRLADVEHNVLNHPPGACDAARLEA